MASFERDLNNLEEMQLTELSAVSTSVVLPDLEAELVGGEVMIAVPLLPLPAIRPLRTIVVHTVEHMFCAILIDGDHVPLFRVALISVISRFKRVTINHNRFTLDDDFDRDLASSLEVGLGCAELIFGFL